MSANPPAQGLLEISPRTDQFEHAGNLDARFDAFDPRKPLALSRVVIDLQECKFIKPQAALWCLTFLALARAQGISCEMLIPANKGVCAYLRSLGLFETLKGCGVAVDDRGVFSGSDAKIILPISRFSTTSEATAVVNLAFTRLQTLGAGAVNLTSAITELLGELTMNAVQHSESPVGAFACVHLLDTAKGLRFTCTVADGGIGVRESLRRNPALRHRVNYDWDALELAVRERVSGTADPHRGIGLYGVSEDVRKPGRSLLLHSGLGSLEITEELESSARRTRLFPGTLAFLSIPT